MAGMDVAWPRRLRWRRRGAWLWPVFVAATVADGVIGNRLPLSGDGEALVGAGLVGLALNVLAVLLLSRPLGALVRRVRPDLPTIVARDYGGTSAVLAVSMLLCTGGLIHHAAIVHDQNAMADAIARAQAFIGDRAPAEFRRNLQFVNTFTIQPGRLYRACVPGAVDRRTYCVIVDTQRPFPGGVRFSGYEPNSTFGIGVN